MKLENNFIYILYTYHPSEPLYFDQSDVILVDGSVDNDNIINMICQKNSCCEDEVEVLGKFNSKMHFLSRTS